MKVEKLVKIIFERVVTVDHDLTDEETFLAAMEDFDPKQEIDEYVVESLDSARDAMTYNQAVAEWVENCLPSIREFETDGFIDIPARRESFNNYKDSLHKGEIITNKQVNEWALPDKYES